MASDEQHDKKAKYDVEPGKFQKLLGYEIIDWDVGYANLVMDISEDHCNRNGLTHGGVLMTLLDAACTRSGTVCPETHEFRRTSTVSMTTNFLYGAKPGRIRVEGRKTGGGRRIYFAEAKAFDEAGNLLATGVATCRYAPKK